jgi:hypothetical protein
VDGYSGTNCDYYLNLTGTCTLPVELVNFKGDNIENRKIKLSWSTLSETNSSHFIIEESQNGKDFIHLNSTPAKGQSNKKTDYSIYDENLFTGSNYYRLSCEDKNGKQEVFSTIMVTNSSHLPKLQVYPNPAKDNLTIDIRHFSAPKVDIEITDMYGRTIWSSALNLDNGSTLQQVNLSEFSNGVYFVKVFDGNNFYKQSLVITKD